MKDLEESPLIDKKDNITRSADESNNNINIINENEMRESNFDLQASDKSKTYKKYKKILRLSKPPEKKYNFFNDKQEKQNNEKQNNEITIKLVISVEETRDYENRIINNMKGHKEQKSNKTVTKTLLVFITLALSLYFGYITKILIDRGIFERQNITKILYLCFILFAMQIITILILLCN